MVYRIEECGKEYFNRNNLAASNLTDHRALGNWIFNHTNNEFDFSFRDRLSERGRKILRHVRLISFAALS